MRGTPVLDLTEGRPTLYGKPLGRRERKKLDTRRRIFRAAFDLFTEQGFDSTTVEEIAQRADVGKGTVYNYFPHKTAFLLAAYREWVEPMQDELGPMDTWTGPARDQLTRVFAFLARKAVEHRPLARLAIFENMRQAHLRVSRPGTGSVPGEGGEGAAFPGESEAVRLLELMARGVIEGGKSRSEIRPEVDDGQAASLIAAAAFHTLVRGLIRGAEAGEIEAAMAAKLDIIFSGLAP